MQTNLLFVLCAASLLGCNSVATKSASDPQTIVVWHKYNSEQINAAASEFIGHNQNASGNLRGFYRMEKNVCHIYTSDTPEDLIVLGHEFKHCVDGKWHDDSWHPFGGVFFNAAM